MNDSGQYWRHVYKVLAIKLIFCKKSLVLLEYLIVCGSESVVQYAFDRIPFLRMLTQSNHYDAYGVNRGTLIRERAQDILNLLSNPDQLRTARANKHLPKWDSHKQTGGNTPAIEYNEDDPDMKKAIEESKKSAQEEEERRRRMNRSSDEFFSKLKTESNGNRIEYPNGGKTVRTIEYIEEVRPSGETIRAENDGSFSEEEPAEYTSSSSEEDGGLMQKTIDREERKMYMPPPTIQQPRMNPFEGTSRNPFQLTKHASLDDPFAESDHALAIPNKDPFMEIAYDEPLQITYSQQSPPPSARPLTIEPKYNIPMPKSKSHGELPDVQNGAKPVLPSNLTPQFSNKKRSQDPSRSYRPG